MCVRPRAGLIALPGSMVLVPLLLRVALQELKVVAGWQ